MDDPVTTKEVIASSQGALRHLRRCIALDINHVRGNLYRTASYAVASGLELAAPGLIVDVPAPGQKAPADVPTIYAELTLAARPILEIVRALEPTADQPVLDAYGAALSALRAAIPSLTGAEPTF